MVTNFLVPRRVAGIEKPRETETVSNAFKRALKVRPPARRRSSDRARSRWRADELISAAPAPGLVDGPCHDCVMTDKDSLLGGGNPTNAAGAQSPEGLDVSAASAGMADALGEIDMRRHRNGQVRAHETYWD